MRADAKVRINGDSDKNRGGRRRIVFPTQPKKDPQLCVESVAARQPKLFLAVDFGGT